MGCTEGSKSFESCPLTYIIRLLGLQNKQTCHIVEPLFVLQAARMQDPWKVTAPRTLSRISGEGVRHRCTQQTGLLRRCEASLQVQLPGSNPPGSVSKPWVRASCHEGHAEWMGPEKHTSPVCRWALRNTGHDQRIFNDLLPWKWVVFKTIKSKNRRW